MSDHRIRFRGAWDWLVTEEGETEVARRLTLPTRWPNGVAPRFRLVRQFGRPPFDPAVESIRLEMLGVPGLIAARLNGREFIRPSGGGGDWFVPLSEPLLARNALALEVDLGQSNAWVHVEDWGSIALVIGPKVDPEK